MADQGGKRSGARSASSRRTAPGTTGRVTPKGTRPPGTKGATPPGPGQASPNRVAPPSGRYTPPVVHDKKVSPRWVPALMFGLLALGVLMIITNYLGVLPGGSDNRYLLAGLAAITGGFIAATQYR